MSPDHCHTHSYAHTTSQTNSLYKDTFPQQAHRHTLTLTHPPPPKAATWRLYRVSCFSPLPHNPSVSHNRKLKERVVAPRAPRLFDLCELLSLMKISAALRTTGAADRGATCSPHNSQRLPTSERCNRSEEGEDVGGRRRGRLERPREAVSTRFPSYGCRLHTNHQV